MINNNQDSINDLNIKPLKPENNNQELPSFEIEQNTENDSGLPIFDNNNGNTNDSEMIDIPLPPVELKSKPPRQRLQDIEDECLIKSPEDYDMYDVKKQIEKENNLSAPIYVNVEDYNTLVSTVESTANNINRFVNIFSNFDNIKNTQHNELVKINKLFENMQRKLIMIDSRIFEKIED